MRQIGEGEIGLDPYRTQIEVITSEQMLDAYSSVGMPLFYKHWSFGKDFARNQMMYNKGYQGLAYEIVINSDPCICYIMEENSATMQTLVLAHSLEDPAKRFEIPVRAIEQQRGWRSRPNIFLISWSCI